jgi:hypothetical protein
MAVRFTQVHVCSLRPDGDVARPNVRSRLLTTNVRGADVHVGDMTVCSNRAEAHSTEMDAQDFVIEVQHWTRRPGETLALALLRNRTA